MSHRMRAEALLLDVLRDGPMSSREVRRLAQEAGINTNGLYDAVDWGTGPLRRRWEPTGMVWWIEQEPTPWRGWL